MEREKLIQKYDKHAKMYENNRDHPKLRQWRKKLLNNANGKVLEVGVGAGANFPYYDQAKIEITAVDFSPNMIESAKKHASFYNIRAEFLQADVEELDFPARSFDCIVSTLTLCSYPDPVATLRNFNKWCREDGSILMIEHGLSSNKLLAVTQKTINPLYRKIAGCHCNREIIKLLESANIKIEHIERFWSDIFCVIWARPAR